MAALAWTAAPPAGTPQPAGAAAATEPGDDAAVEQPFSVGLMGDFPSSPEDARRMEPLLADVNAKDLALVVHVGDIKGGSTPCSEEVLLAERERLNRIVHPVLYTPGDNEWVDCHRTGGDPAEQLATLRQLFFSTPMTLGETPIRVRRQHHGYPENAHRFLGGINFATLNIPGSNNNLHRDPEEHRARMDANLRWLDGTFAAAERRESAGVVLAIQANPRFEQPADQRPAYDEFVSALRRHVLDFGKPVLLLHGDTHNFRVDTPLRDVPNLTRVETFGTPDVHWVRIGVDPTAENLFTAVPQIVEDNPPPAE